MIYVVLGLGFSGTTLVSELLHHSRIRMIDEEGDHYDSGGKYEHPEFQQINRELLGLTNDQAFHLRPSDCPTNLSDSQKARMLRLIERQQSCYENWGFKDPRTVVTYPLWNKILPPHRIIAVYRDAAESWPRHRWRGLRRRYSNAWRAFVHLRQWHEYNNAILEYGRNINGGFLLLNYQKLMKGNTEFERLRNFVGCTIKDRRKKNLYRTHSAGDMLFRAIKFNMSLLHKYSPILMQNRLDAACNMQRAAPVIIDSEKRHSNRGKS